MPRIASMPQESLDIEDHRGIIARFVDILANQYGNGNALCKDHFKAKFAQLFALLYANYGVNQWKEAFKDIKQVIHGAMPEAQLFKVEFYLKGTIEFLTLLNQQFKHTERFLGLNDSLITKW